MQILSSKAFVDSQVSFVGGMPIKTKKDHLLANSKNKPNFILIHSEKLKGRGFQPFRRRWQLIAQTAFDSASKCTTTVTGECTDLLVLLCRHTDPSSFALFFGSEGRRTINKVRICNINWMHNALVREMCNWLSFGHAIPHHAGLI